MGTQINRHNSGYVMLAPSIGVSISIATILVSIVVTAYIHGNLAANMRTTSRAVVDLPAILATAPSITCDSERYGARKEIFSTALFMPQWVGSVHDDTRWEKDYLEETADVLRSHFQKVSLPSSTPPYLRFGHQPTDGSIDSNGILRTGYHWKDALNNDQWSIDDYVAYTRRVGASPQVVVNFGTADATDAGDLVAYSNGIDPADPMVALRHRRGHKDPYAIQVWEIGNEQYGHWEAGFTSYPDGSIGSRDPDAYARRVNVFADQMRARSPSPVKLYAPLSDWELRSYPEPALRSIIAQTAASLDGYVIHYYPLPADGESAEMWAAMPHALGTKLELLNQMLGEVTGKPMEIAITEWAGSAFPTHMGRNWLTGLLMVDSYLAMAEQGVVISNYFASATPRGVPGGYSYWLDGDPKRPAPTLVAAEQTADHLGRSLLRTYLNGAPRESAVSFIGEKFEYSAISALCSEDHGTRGLVVVNRSSRSLKVNVSLNFAVREKMRITRLTGDPWAESVNIRCALYGPDQHFSLELHPFSVTLVSIPREERAEIGLGTTGTSPCPGER